MPIDPRPTSLRRAALVLAALPVIACHESKPPADTEETASGGIHETASATGSSSGDATDAGSATMTGGDASSSGGGSSGGGSSGSATVADSSSSSNPEGSSSADASASGSTTSDIVPCDVAMATLEPLPPNVMLVLDKSGSMVSNTWDHDDNGATPEITRWDSLYQVVDFVVSTFDAQINFGATLFPAINATATYNANACVMSNAPEIPVAPTNANAILAGIPGAAETMIYGGTPATAGVTLARDNLVSLNPQNPRAIVLVTDGAANCSGDAGTNFERFEVYDDQLPVVVGDAWTNDAIPTYVVGIDALDAVSPVANDGFPDSTNTFDVLNDVAEAGGKPLVGMAEFYQTTNQNELQDALQQIIDDALSCIVPLDPEPAFPDLLEVVIDDMNVPAVDDCASEDGWVYTNPGGPYDAIELCGTWCDALKVAGSVTAEYYCNPG